MTGRGLTIAACLFAGIAVAVSPISARLPGVPLTVCDAALALAALCVTSRQFVQRDKKTVSVGAVAGPLMLLVACGLSGACATDWLSAAKDGVQLVLYLVVGTTVFRSLNGKRWRRRDWQLRSPAWPG